MNINLTILGQSIAFAFFVWFCMKFIWPPIMGALRARQHAIGLGLQQAEEAERKLQAANAEADKILVEAKESAREIIEQADSRAGQIIEQAKGQAVAEGEQIKEAAQAEIEREVSRAREGLREQLSDLVMAGAEKVLGASVDRKQHAGALKDLTAQL